MANKTVNWIEELAKYNAANNVSVLNTLPTKVQDELVMRIATETAKLLRADQESGNFPSAPSADEIRESIIELPDVPAAKAPAKTVFMKEYSFKKGNKTVRTAACSITGFTPKASNEPQYYQYIPGVMSPSEVHVIAEEFKTLGAEEVCRRYKALNKLLLEGGFIKTVPDKLDNSIILI